jgi:serine/threonine protein kinase
MAHERLPFRIGHYRVQRLLGAGGMGKVYLCEDERRGGVVAVKCAGGRRHEATHVRLRSEAKVLARLEHPNIVRLLDSGEYDGRPFLVLEHVEGTTLREWLKIQRTTRDVLMVFVHLGAALAAVHDSGFVHRDVKPDNVLIGADGLVKLADFGLARRIDEHSGAPEPSSPSRGGTLIGTRAYMPVEQILGTKLDARCDQFSFCASAYEAIWGELPFDDLGTDMRAQALERASPREPVNRRDIYRLLQRGLQRDAAARWPNMSELVAALEGVSGPSCSLRTLVLRAGLGRD